jgi:hypothetical protein
MPRCENCGKAIGLVKSCPSCGGRTILDRRTHMDEERFESFGSAIMETYAAKRARARPQNPLHVKTPLWVTLAACLLVAMVAVALVRVRQQPAAQPKAAAIVARSTIVRRKAARPRTPPPPSPTPVPTATPSPVPTSAPTPTITPSPLATATLSADDAPALVRSNSSLTVGKKGSCGGDNVTIDVRGFTRGCTFFGLADGGPLANRKGTVLIVPVSTTEDIADVAYGLLYVRSKPTDPPRYVGLLAGDGSGPLVMRVQNGLILAQNGARTEYFTFDGRRIVRVRR